MFLIRFWWGRGSFLLFSVSPAVFCSNRLMKPFVYFSPGALTPSRSAGSGFKVVFPGNIFNFSYFFIKKKRPFIRCSEIRAAETRLVSRSIKGREIFLLRLGAREHFSGLVSPSTVTEGMPTPRQSRAAFCFLVLSLCMHACLMHCPPNHSWKLAHFPNTMMSCVE